MNSLLLLLSILLLLFSCSSVFSLAQPQHTPDPDDIEERDQPTHGDHEKVAAKATSLALSQVSPSQLFPIAQLDAISHSSSNSARLLRNIDKQLRDIEQRPNEFCFISHGCWGGSKFGQVTHRKVAKIIAQSVLKYNARFVLAAGDNFYERGIKSVNDPLFQKVFTNVYVQPYLEENKEEHTAAMKDIPFVAADGNHDARGNVFAQVNMTMRDPNWFLPHTYFTVMLRAASLAIVVLDCPLFERCVVNPPGSPRCWDNHKQKHFLEAALKFVSERGIRFRAVMCHYPLYANGPHINHRWLKNLLDPVMERYGVSLYINADNHYLQVAKRENKNSDAASAPPIYYVNSGGGGGYRLHKRTDKGYKKDPFDVFEFIGNGIFLHCLDFERDVIRNVAISDEGKELFEFEALPAVVKTARKPQLLKTAKHSSEKKPSSGNTNVHVSEPDWTDPPGGTYEYKLVYTDDFVAVVALAAGCLLTVGCLLWRRSRKVMHRA